MKAKSLLFIATLASFLTEARAQTFAPDSVANTVISFAVSVGNPPVLTGGIGRRVLTPVGLYYDVTANGDPRPGQAGSFTYQKTSPTQARLVFSSEGAVLDGKIDLTFSTEIGGTFADKTLASPAIPVGGTFCIAPFSTGASLVNMSVRAVLGPGQNLNPGFVIAGTSPRQVLIRAVGPTLAKFGVAGAMPNPKLTVFEDVAPLGTNDDWEKEIANTPDSSAADIEQAVAATGAFPLATGSRDAAIVMTMRPGVYTAVLEGSTKTDAGAVMLEVYLVK